MKNKALPNKQTDFCAVVRGEGTTSIFQKVATLSFLKFMCIINEEVHAAKQISKPLGTNNDLYTQQTLKKYQLITAQRQ